MTVPAETLAAALAAATHRGAPGWQTVGARARHLALGLAEAGMAPGTTITVGGALGDDRLATELAVMAAGAATTADPDGEPSDLLADLETLAEKGAAADGERPDRFEELVASVAPDDVATVAGGHRLTHRNLVWAARSLIRWLGATPADRFLVRGDPADVAIRLTGVYLPVMLGAAAGDREAKPTVVFADAPFWADLAGRATAEVPDRALRVARARTAGDPLGVAERVRARWGTRAVRRVHQGLGLGECRAFVCLGPVPAPGVIGELAAVGIDVVATWGHPGVAGLAAAGNPPCPLPGMTVGIDDDGTIALRSAAAADPGGDGWLRTGQPGTLDDRGALRT